MFTDAATQPIETTGEFDLGEDVRAAPSVSWRQRYEAHFDFAWRVARRLGVPEADLEDVVHEAFEVALTKADQFDHGQFSTWLYRIVANISMARARKHRLRDVLHGLWSQDDEPQVSSVESTVAARRTLAAVEVVLRALPEKKREVFALHELEGLSHEQIGRLLDCKVETVRTRLHYAKQDFEQAARKKGLLP